MAEGLGAYLGRDLGEALVSGAARTPSVSADGGRWLVLWALGCALAGLTLVLFGGYHAGFVQVNGIAAQAPGWIWQWLTLLGDERVAFALALFFSRRYPRVFWALIVTALIAVAYTHSLKPLFSALRPPAVLEPGSFNLIGPGHRKGSFPSGHTVTAAVLFGVWVYFARPAWLRACLILVAVAAGLSRVALGVHWPVDVAAGLFGGAAAVWVGVILARKSPWGVVQPLVHLVLVAVAAGFALALLFSDGGYTEAVMPQRLLGIAALGFAVFAYFVGPALRWRRVRIASA